ncbi:hypothetical protein NESM_000866500 [Novymonas esmeraldas]|uniref:Exportin-1/Importin-beta-like domain-containing protein n=1 Tax=Novymonas esmeraldas TaxID=1808958 RepID=A0AAW0EYB0_9TRYP
MSWCTAQQVAQLIAVARLRGDVDEATRKAADAQLMDVCANAVNAGDALVQVATEGSASPGLRMNAVLAAETLFTPKGWCEGAQFSDRSAVTQLLLQHQSSCAAAHPTSPLASKVDAGVLRCLALVVALDYPAAEWQQWVHDCAVAFTAGDAGARAALQAVVAESHRNHALWRLLANDVVAHLLDSAVAALPLRTAVTSVLLDLMRRRPRPAAEHEIPSATNCLLLSAVVREGVLAALLARVGEAAQLAGPSSDVFAADCTASFAVASRLIADAESAVVIFSCSAFFLVQLQGMPAERHSRAVLRELAEQLLECLLGVLQLYPDVAGRDVGAEGLLACLVGFMVRPDAPERSDAAQLSAELLEYFMDDEAVPVGCGSGDEASLAGAVLEMYLEHHSAQRPVAIAALNAMLRATPVMDGALAAAVALALRSVSRVYEASDSVVVDALDGAVQAELLSQVAQLLLCTSDPHARVMLIDALVHCFYRSHNEALCAQLTALLQQLYVSAAASADACDVCVRYACVYAAGRLLDELRLHDWCGRLLAPEWVHLCLQLLCDGDTFGVFSAASTLCTLLGVAPASAAQLAHHGAVWEQGLLQLCRHATVRGVAALLTLTLKHLAGLSSAVPHGDGALAVRSCHVTLEYCRSATPSRHLVLRSLVDFFAALARARLQQHGGRTAAADDAHCTNAFCALASALLTEEYGMEMAQDEPGCRAFATFAALHCTTTAPSQPSAEPTVAVSALVATLRHAVAQCYASQTISCVCGQLACILLPHPALLDGAATAVLHTLFQDGVDLGVGRRGVHYGGAAFLVSLLLLQCPHALALQSGGVGGVCGGASTAEHRAVLQRGFGWWVSLAPFMDAVQLRFFTAATGAVMEMLLSLPVDVQGGLGALADCRQYLLPSTHVKKLPPRPLSHGSIAQHLAVAWVDLQSRYGRTSKPQLLDKDLLPVLAALGGPYCSLCSPTISAGHAHGLLRESPADTIAAVLAYMEHVGWSDVVHVARQQVGAAGL